MDLRPISCQICRCPVADTGVRVDDLDPEKLSSWWALQERLQNIELDDLVGVVPNLQICEFCVWDARSRYEEEIMLEECDWWTGHDTNKFFKEFYYKEKLIRPCSVKISSGDCKLAEEKSARIRSPASTLNAQLASKRSWKPSRPLRSPPHQRRPLKSPSHRYILAEHNYAAREPSLPVPAPRLQCPFCTETVMTQNSMIRHIQESHKLVANKCDHPSCSQYFASENDKRQHTARHHGRNNVMAQCPFCPCTQKLDYMRSHILKVHKSLVFKCDPCFAFFRTEEEQHQHFLDSHDEDSAHRCIYCQEMFTSSLVLHTHVSHLHVPIMIKCDKAGCTTYFKNEADHLQHSIEFHKSGECSECEFKTPFEKDLETHMEAVHGVKIFPCTKCKKELKSSEALKNHMSSAHAEKVCEHCELLVKRIKQHQTSLPCKYCEEMTPCLTLRMLHEKRCTSKSQSFVTCVYCDKIYVSSAALHWHMKTAHTMMESHENFEIDDLSNGSDCLSQTGAHPSALQHPQPQAVLVETLPLLSGVGLKDDKPGAQRRDEVAENKRRMCAVDALRKLKDAAQGRTGARVVMVSDVVNPSRNTTPSSKVKRPETDRLSASGSADVLSLYSVVGKNSSPRNQCEHSEFKSDNLQKLVSHRKRSHENLNKSMVDLDLKRKWAAERIIKILNSPQSRKLVDDNSKWLNRPEPGVSVDQPTPVNKPLPLVDCPREKDPSQKQYDLFTNRQINMLTTVASKTASAQGVQTQKVPKVITIMPKLRMEALSKAILKKPQEAQCEDDGPQREKLCDHCQMYVSDIDRHWIAAVCLVCSEEMPCATLAKRHWQKNQGKCQANV